MVAPWRLPSAPVLLMISVVVMETTAGATRAATSANEGVATEVTVPWVVWIGPDCAFDFLMKPRSAVMRTPKATDAMMIAIVEKIRLPGYVMSIQLLVGSCLYGGRAPQMWQAWSGSPKFVHFECQRQSAR